MAKDSLDWWGKRESPDGKEPNKRGGKGGAPRAQGARKPKKAPLTRRQFWLRVAINAVVIGVLGVLMAVVAHFTLQGLTRHGAHCEVPQLVDLTMAEARALVAESELNLVINDSLYAPGVGRGVILAQLPAEGTVVKPGRSIYLTVNTTSRRMVNVPYVAGRSLRQAKNMLEVAGLVIERLEYEEDIATNYILGQSYEGREVTAQSTLTAPVGSGVTLRVGANRGDNSTTVPEVMGRSMHAARSALWSAGLNVGSIEMEADVSAGNEHLTMVYEQSIEADSVVTLGSDVALKLTLHKAVLDTVYVRRARAERAEARRLVREKFIADSIALIEAEMVDSLGVDSLAVEPEVVEPRRRPTAAKVEFEDLF